MLLPYAFELHETNDTLIAKTTSIPHMFLSYYEKTGCYYQKTKTETKNHGYSWLHKPMTRRINTGMTLKKLEN